MTKPLLTVVLLCALALSTGCGFSRKSNQPKESSAISSEVEATFRQRWIEKRTAELAAQGTTAETARQQADQEFRERYVFDQKPKK